MLKMIRFKITRKTNQCLRLNVPLISEITSVENNLKKNSIDVHSMYNQEQYVFLCFSNNGRMENLHFSFIASSRG